MTAGPFDPPPGAALAGVPHGAEVSEAQALTLAGRPEFPEHWAIVPSADGSRLFLLWGDACSTAELERSITWGEGVTASLQAEGTPRGEA